MDDGVPDLVDDDVAKRVTACLGGGAVTSAVSGLAMAALVADGVLVGASLDKVIVQLPARRRMGAVAYAGYARSADLGHGVAFYGVVGVSAAVLTLAAFGAALASSAPGSVTGALVAAAVLSVLHSALTGRAAPTMFRIGRAEDTEAELAPLLTRFARWSAVRAVAQMATLVAVAVAVGLAL